MNNFVMKINFFFLILICLYLTGCIQNKPVIEEYPVIDVVNNVGNYQRFFCSDFFSSLELIPLETGDNSLIGESPVVLLKDSFLFICSTISPFTIPLQRNLLAFNRSGKFLNQIGGIGGGPGEYIGISGIFLNYEKPSVFVDDGIKIIEYEETGKLIGSFPLPRVDGHSLSNFSYLEKNLFFGSISYFYSAGSNFFLFDRNGVIIKSFPNRYFYNSENRNSLLLSINPFRIDKQLYLKDYINDTLYTLVDLNLKPVNVFDFGKYSYPKGKINEEGLKEIIPVDIADSGRVMRVTQIVGTPNFFFYSVFVPQILPRPNARPIFYYGREVPNDIIIYGIYDIAMKTNVLLDTDRYHQKGLINDVNGGLSFFPKYYAGDDIVVDIWQAYDMKEMLTEEYFASQSIKDPQAHQKLRELLKILQEDDNPIVVIAKLK